MSVKIRKPMPHCFRRVNRMAVERLTRYIQCELERFSVLGRQSKLREKRTKKENLGIERLR